MIADNLFVNTRLKRGKNNFGQFFIYSTSIVPLNIKSFDENSEGIICIFSRTIYDLTIPTVYQIAVEILYNFFNLFYPGTSKRQPKVMQCELTSFAAFVSNDSFTHSGIKGIQRPTTDFNSILFQNLPPRKSKTSASLTLTARNI